MGARAYRCLTFYEPEPGCLVEVGAERGEGSTAWLYDFSRRHGLTFYSADIDPDVCRVADRIAPGRIRNVSGREMLRRIRKPVSIAYLDGYDWIPPGHEAQEWVAIQRSRYAELGIEHHNEASEREHLDEAVLVQEKAARRCVVICDDTYKQDGEWRGKGALAVPWLCISGFRVVDHESATEHSLGAVVLIRD